jgi:hypothetical protein
VLLHGALAHEQSGGDRGVVPARRHLLEDLALAVGQPEDRSPVAGSLAGHQRLDHLGVEHRAAAADLAHRADQLGDVADALLEQIAQTGHAVDEQLERVVLLDVLRQHHHPHVRVLGADPLGGLDALIGVRGWHPDVGEHGVGRRRRDGPHQRDRVARHRHHLDLVDLCQERGQAFTDQEVVVGHDEAERHSCDPTHGRTPARSC